MATSSRVPKRPRRGKKAPTPPTSSSSSSEEDDFFSPRECARREALFQAHTYGVQSWTTTNFLRGNGFLFVQKLTDQKLMQFIEFHGPIYIRLVRQFYANLRYSDSRYESCVEGVIFQIRPRDLESVFGISRSGTNTYTADTDAIYRSLLRPDRRYNGEEKKAIHMTAPNRVLHHIVSHQLIPQSSANYSKPTQLELRLMDAILNDNLLNWSTIILGRMIKAGSSKPSQWMPYPMHVCRLLRFYNVPIPQGEEFFDPQEDLHAISDGLLRQMKMSFHGGQYFWSDQVRAMEAQAAAEEAAARQGLDAEQVAQEEAEFDHAEGGGAEGGGAPVDDPVDHIDFSTHGFQDYRVHFDARMDYFDGRLDRLEQNVHEQQDSLGRLETQFGVQSSMLYSRLEQHSSQMNARFDQQSSQLNARFDDMMAAFGRFFPPPPQDPPAPDMF